MSFVLQTPSGSFQGTGEGFKLEPRTVAWLCSAEEHHGPGCAILFLDVVDLWIYDNSFPADGSGLEKGPLFVFVQR